MHIQTVVFFLLLIISTGYCAWGVWWHYRIPKLGRPEDRNDHRWERFRFVGERILLLSKIRDYPAFAVFHIFIMWGFVILLFSSLDMAAYGLFQIQIPVLGTNAVFLLFRDTFIVLVAVGVIGSILRRQIHRPEWLNNSNMAYVVLILIFFIVVSELLYFAAQVTRGEALPPTAWLVHVVAVALTAYSEPTLFWVAQISWWFHYLLIFTFLFLIPGSKHLHILFAAPNVYWRSLEPKGALLPVQLEENQAGSYGARHLLDFTWKQMFDAASCVKCGRCNGQCPARQSGDLIKPKKINGRIRKYMEQEGREIYQYLHNTTGNDDQNGPKAADGNKVNRKKTKLVPKILTKELVGDIFEPEAIWSCTTCGACVEACPINVEHTSKIIDMRRGLISSLDDERDIPPEIKLFIENMEQHGNPLGKERVPGALTKELELPSLREKPDAEFLYFVGCAATFDESARQTAKAFAKILKTAGVDVAILDEEEGCCGETVRRIGNERLFQATVKRNIAQFAARSVRKIITTCPHCSNTFKNEYPQFGGHYEVIPYTVFLAGLLQQGVIKPTGSEPLRVTYHDPCYLGRYNGYFQESRELINAIPGIELIEMPRSRERSFCCGAGGGRYWTTERENNPISKNRVQEALNTGAEIIVTACPYCHDALQTDTLQSDMQQPEQNRKVMTLDVAELLEYCRTAALDQENVTR